MRSQAARLLLSGGYMLHKSKHDNLGVGIRQTWTVSDILLSLDIRW